MSATGPVLLFGGSFDPPHRAHVELGLAAADLIGASRILLIPAGVNPQKIDHPPTEARHRLAMLEAATRHDPRVEISTVELDREGPSWMIDTVERLAADAPEGTRFRLLIGADQALNFDTWRRWRDLERLAEPLILPRAPYDAAALTEALAERHPGDADRWGGRILPLPCLEGSSTDVRTLIAAGEALDPLLAEPVADYIRANGLYGHGADRGRIRG